MHMGVCIGACILYTRLVTCLLAHLYVIPIAFSNATYCGSASLPTGRAHLTKSLLQAAADLRSILFALLGRIS